MTGRRTLPGTGQVFLQVNETMPPGEYAFMVGAITPAQTPERNFFSLLVKNFDDNVVDARMRFEGSSCDGHGRGGRPFRSS